MDEYSKKVILDLDVENCKIYFSIPAKCYKEWSFLPDEIDRGCKHYTRLWYPEGCGCHWHWNCPICGEPYSFTFWKIKTDHNYIPTKEQEEDIRNILRDAKRMALGEQPTYNVLTEKLIKIHECQ